jgi:hypothetical protein
VSRLWNILRGNSGRASPPRTSGAVRSGKLAGRVAALEARLRAVDNPERQALIDRTLAAFVALLTSPDESRGEPPSRLAADFGIRLPGP